MRLNKAALLVALLALLTMCLPGRAQVLTVSNAATSAPASTAQGSSRAALVSMMTSIMGEQVVPSAASYSFDASYLAYTTTLTSPATFTLDAGYSAQSETLTFCQSQPGAFPVTPPANVVAFPVMQPGQKHCLVAALIWLPSQSVWRTINLSIQPL